MKMGKAMIGVAAAAALMGGGLGADLRHLDTPSNRLEREHKRKRLGNRGDVRNPKRKKSTRAWRKKVAKSYPQRMKDRSAFCAAVRANPANRMTNWQNTLWMAAGCPDPDPFLAMKRRAP